MKKMLTCGLVVVGVLAISAFNVSADGCAAKKAAKSSCAVSCKSAAKAASSCETDCFAALKLTSEQQASLKKLSSECSGIKCSKTSKAKMEAGLKKVLTEEQLAKLEKVCTQEACPYNVAKSDEKRGS